jgi:hypothetical protein
MIPILACEQEAAAALRNFDQEDVCIFYSHPCHFANDLL